MTITPRPTSLSSKRTISAAKPPSSPSARKTLKSPSNHYGSILPTRHDPSYPYRLPSHHRPPPVGPLARVPSDPSFVPVMALDLDTLASELSDSVGAEYTTGDLLSSLADVSSNPQHPHHTDHNILPDDAIWQSPQLEDHHTHHPASLEVVLAEEEALNFSDETLVLRIRPHKEDDEYIDRHDTDSDVENPHHEHAYSQFQHPENHDPDLAGGFAINIPVTTEPASSSPDLSTSWGCSPSTHMSDRYPDEECPLLDEPGLNMSYRSRASLPTEGAALVQRTGARDVAEEQQVLYAVPNAESLGSRPTGLLLPVINSRNDLTQLMFVVPPETPAEEEEQALHVEDENAPVTTVEAIRENVDILAAKLPGMVDIESTLEVHGTVDDATVAMNVTKQVSWVGYLILGIALASVASQGTAVKWLPDVDGMIAATWLMQTQTLLMLPFAIFQYCTLNEEEHEKLRQPSTIQKLVLTSLSQVGWAMGFFLAVDYTLLFHAWSLSNIHALFIVLMALFRRDIMRAKDVLVSSGEMMGAQIATVGVLLMWLPLIASGNLRGLFGDSIATLGSFGAIAFLQLCKSLRNDIPLFIIMTPVTAMNAVLFSVISMGVGGTDFSATDHGAFGWMQSDRLLLGLYLGGVVGFLGTICCIAALKFLPSVVVGSVQTMMPVAGTLTAVLVGVDTLPDVWTTLGGGVMMYGVLLIAEATRQSEVTVVLNSHISEIGVVKGKS